MNDLSDRSAWVATRQIGELLDRRRITQARALLAQALRDAPDDAGLLYEAARADWLDDREASARDTLRRVLAIDPDHLPGRVLMFELLVSAGELPDAEAMILALLREAPRDADLWARYSRLMLRALHLRKARDLAREALRLEPHSEAALRAQALCDLVTLRRATDSASLQKMLAANPDDVHTLMLVCAALQQAGRPRAALAVAKELLRARPADDRLLGLVKALRWQTHWTLWPLWPLQRFGWAGSIGLWLGAVVAFRLLPKVADPQLVSLLSNALLGYVAYSWIWPPLLKRWLDRR